MGQLWRVLVGTEYLVGFVTVLVVVTMPLELEERVVGDSVRGIPRVSDVNLFVGAVRKLLSLKPIVFDVVDELEDEDSSEGSNQVIESHH